MRINQSTLAIAALALTTAAYSDTTLTTTVTSSDAVNFKAPVAGVYTTYYSGTSARTTRPDGYVWIFDFSANNVTTLTPELTYYVQSLSSFLNGSSSTSSVNSTLSSDSTALTGTTAGLSTVEYKWSIQSGANSKTAAATGTIPPTLRRMMRRSSVGTTMSSTASSVPTYLSGTFEMAQVSAGFSAIQFGIPQLAISLAGNPGLSALAAKVQQSELVPLAIYGSVAKATSLPNTNSVATFSSEVTKTSSDSVSASLFVVPSNYTKVSAPVSSQ